MQFLFNLVAFFSKVTKEEMLIYLSGDLAPCYLCGHHDISYFLSGSTFHQEVSVLQQIVSSIIFREPKQKLAEF